jgi:hypothetical protein
VEQVIHAIDDERMRELSRAASDIQYAHTGFKREGLLIQFLKQSRMVMQGAELRKLGEMRDPQGVSSRLRDVVADPNAFTFEEILFGNIVTGRCVYGRLCVSGEAHTSNLCE